MFADFFQTMPVPVNQMLGTYDMRLVVLSYLVATFVSFIALDITGRLRDVGNSELVSLMWLIGGAVAMGAGIWSMHFIGMLAFTMPGMAMNYDPFWTVISLFVAILGSAFALVLLKPKIINWMHIILGGILFGLSIASMHYIGMHAMEVSMKIHYLQRLH
jgi:NO-binding membrane sensor protein with MHYT domain